MSFVESRIFLGSSRESLDAAKAVAHHLRFLVRFVEPWPTGTFHLSHFPLDDLLQKATEADFAVLVLADEDMTESRGSKQASPRDNTVFEAGLFMGALGRERVFLIVPEHVEIKLPTDLRNFGVATYRPPAGGGSWATAVQEAAYRIECEVRRLGPLAATRPVRGGPHYVYASLADATPDIREASKAAVDIKVMSNRGLSILGTDDSVLSTAEISEYAKLKKLRVLLLSPTSRWLSRGYVELRDHHPLDQYLAQLQLSQAVVEHGFKAFGRILGNSRSGIKYFTGEPYWRLVITEDVAFVSSYADDTFTQARDLPVARYDRLGGSFYDAFKRYFNDVWHNQSEPGSSMTDTIDLTVSAGGVVYRQADDLHYEVLLLGRPDGRWTLPKGHRLSGEPLTETALREVSEESGIPQSALSIERQLGSYVDTSFNESKVVHLFSMRCRMDLAVELRPDIDHSDARWFGCESAFPEFVHPDQRLVLDDFISRLGSMEPR